MIYSRQHSEAWQHSETWELAFRRVRAQCTNLSTTSTNHVASGFVEGPKITPQEGGTLLKNNEFSIASIAGVTVNSPLRPSNVSRSPRLMATSSRFILLASWNATLMYGVLSSGGTRPASSSILNSSGSLSRNSSSRSRTT